MNPLDIAYASPGKEVLIPTIELSCEAWLEPILIVNGFDPITARTEDGRLLTFEPTGMDVAMPKKDNTGNQTVQFAIDGVTGIAQKLIQQAMDANKRVNLTLRLFLDTDLSQPATKPYFMSVKGGSLKPSTIQVQAGYFDLINTAWPRDLYDATSFPCIKYL